MDQLISTLIERVVAANEKRILAWLGMTGKAAKDAITFNCAAYIGASFEKCSKVTTLLDRDEATPLNSIYVTTYLSHQDRVISDDRFKNMIRIHTGFVIQGRGGSGKSVFMKYIFTCLLASSQNYIPIFVELRKINEVTSKDLLAFIFGLFTSPSGASMTLKQFQNGVANGSFALLLDGLDEVDSDHYRDIQRQIIQIKDDFPSSVIIVSSRPDESFLSWQSFKIYYIQPMQKKETLLLVKRLQFDNQLKKRFYDSIQGDLYDLHKSFLSNPLLITIMLITFHHFAEVPQKIHLFYEFAYEALFFRHDASKEAAYSRRKKTKLAINEFRNMLSAFSMFTYAKERFSLSASEALDYIHEAKNFEEIDVDSQEYFDDLKKAVCILQADGTLYSFTHRSFQEYFAAVFLTRSKMSNVGEMLNWVVDTRKNDSVALMAHSMSPSLVERDWILPNLKDILQNYPLPALEFIKSIGGRPKIVKGDNSNTIMIIHSGFGINLLTVFRSLFPRFFESAERIFDREGTLNESKLLRARKELTFNDQDNDFFEQLTTGIWFRSIQEGAMSLLKFLEERHSTVDSKMSELIKLSGSRRKGT